MVEKYKLMSGALFTALWIQLCLEFICSDLFPVLSGIQNYVYLLTDAVYFILGLITIRKRSDIFIFVSFVVIAVVSAIVNDQGIVVLFNGAREFFGLLFVPPVLRYFLTGPDGTRFVRSLDRQLYIFLWIQLPCLLFQFIQHGAGDYGGGSLSYGNSGIITTLIFAISFYLINKRWDSEKSYFGNLWDNRVLVILLFMSLLNETKICFVYMAAYFIFLMKIDRRFILRCVLATPLIAVIIAFCGYLYYSTTESEFDIYTTEFIDDYFFGEDLDHLVDMAINIQYAGAQYENQVDLPRIGRFLLLPDMFDETNGGWFLGAGVGQFKGGSVISTTALAANYQWLFLGSVVALFFIVVQLGIVGVIWFLCSLFSIVLTPDKYYRGVNITVYMFSVFLLMLVYNDMVRQPYVCFILFYICMRGLQPVMHADLKLEKATVK